MSGSGNAQVEKVGKDDKDNLLRIGDFITLKYLKRSTYLNAEGVISEDVEVSSTLKQFEDHVFQIYVQKQYSATNELDEFEQAFEDVVQDKGNKNHHEALLKGKENEAVLNENVMKNKTGQILLFGDLCQLMHVKSKKFVTTLPTDLARDEVKLTQCCFVFRYVNRFMFRFVSRCIHALNAFRPVLSSAAPCEAPFSFAS
jgi:hypothetical protein